MEIEMRFVGDISDYIDREKEVLGRMDLSQIDNFIKLLLDARDANSNIYIMGNGGSGATASHFASDFNKGLSYGFDKRFRFICLNDNMPIFSAYANDIGYDNVFVEPLKNFHRSGDLTIGISSSGNSKNILDAIEYANSSGGITIGLTGYDGGRLAKLAKHIVHVPVHDMQIVEDIHMILDHMIMRILYKTISQK